MAHCLSTLPVASNPPVCQQIAFPFLLEFVQHRRSTQEDRLSVKMKLLFIARDILDTVGVGLQITNSACNLAVTALLGVSLKASEATRSYFIVHVVILFLSALAVAGLCSTTRRGLTSPIRSFLLGLVGYIFAPAVCVLFLFRNDSKPSRFLISRPQAKTAALREEEAELKHTVRWSRLVYGLVELTKDSHVALLFQLGFEGIPLLLTQLVMTVQGFLGEPTNVANLAAFTALKVLVYVSMASVGLQLASHAYLLCRSFDLRVFCLKWLFCLYDLTTMLYMIVFLTTIGKPFASFKQLAAGDFSGGYGLSQAWLLGYLIVAGMVAVLLLVALIAHGWKRGWDVWHTAILLLGMIGCGPGVAMIFGVKTVLLGLVVSAMEPYAASLTYTGGVPVMLLFGFLRKGDWENRYQHFCRFIYSIVRTQDVKPTVFASMKDAIISLWRDQFPGSPPLDDVPPERFEPPTFRSQLNSNEINRFVASAFGIFCVFQGFTFVFPIVTFSNALQRTEESWGLLCTGLFLASVAELALMVPLLPRFRLYWRFLVQCGSLADFSLTLENYFNCPTPTGSDGKPVSIIEAAIQAYYTPPHEYVIVRMIQDGFMGNRKVPQTLLPYDVVSYLSTFCSESHIELSSLSREEATILRLAAPESASISGPGDGDGAPRDEEVRLLD
jgi:hypothetical protein